jgi:hypothetical protein
VIAMFNGAQDRETTHREWSAELRTLLADLHRLTDPVGGDAAAAHMVSQCRQLFKQALQVAWPAYSTGYYDRLRSQAAAANVTSVWHSYVSAPPVVPTAVPGQQVTIDPTIVTDADLDQLIADLTTTHT